MDDVVVLQWTFTPPDYFESAIEINRDTYTMLIDNGKIEARIDFALYDNSPGMRDDLHKDLESRFLGVQLITGTKYELSKPTLVRLLPDGRREYTLFIESVNEISLAGSVDLVVRDKDGNIVSDSRQERIAKKKELSALVEKLRPQDQTLDSLLNFYKTSIYDSANELIHLYDIWEAIQTKFSSAEQASTSACVTLLDNERQAKLVRIIDRSNLFKRFFREGLVSRPAVHFSYAFNFICHFG